MKPSKMIYTYGDPSNTYIHEVVYRLLHRWERPPIVRYVLQHNEW